MKILQVHNRYLTGRGGEDTVLDQEFELLRNRNNEINQLIVQTADVDVEGLKNKAATAVQCVWSQAGYRLTEKAIADFAPDVIHVHNTFPLLSPSVYFAAQRHKVPVVHTLHNYRLICCNGLLLRDGNVCEECVGRSSLPGLVHKCYKDSFAGTLPVAAIRTVHRSLGTYENQVDKFIVLTNFAKNVFVRDGFQPDRILVKPNFIADPYSGYPDPKMRKKTVVYVGRLVEEKGVDLLIEAWKRLDTDYRLVIIGSGREQGALKELAGSRSNIEWRGWLDRQTLSEEVAQSRFLVLPSRWYEGLPMVLIEAVAAGTPAIVPNLGAVPEIISHGRAGYVFDAGSVLALETTLRLALLQEAEWTTKSFEARRIYLERFTPEENYKTLLGCYEGVIADKRREPVKSRSSFDIA